MPPELLGSQRFKNMMAALSEHFDWVLLDAPPVVPVTDACVIANNNIGVLFVVGAERISRSVARRALSRNRASCLSNASRPRRAATAWPRAPISDSYLPSGSKRAWRLSING